MKLRVKGNTVIFRVSRSEVMTLYERGRIAETVYLTEDQESKLVYAIEHMRNCESATLRYESPEIVIVLPSGKLEDWIHSDECLLYGIIDLGDLGAIDFFVEKDCEFLDKDQRVTSDI
jgi:hypothetical protein